MTPVEQSLARLVAFPTVSDQPVEPLVAWLADRCDSAGLRVERISAAPGKCNLLCSAGPVGTDGILLSGHMDVVPVVGQPWETDPFTMTRQGERLVGRGTCDMKAFIAAVVEALPRIAVHRLKRELVLLFTYDEEVGCLGSRAFADHILDQERPLPSLALIGEPTSFRILHMHPGHVAIRIECIGRAAHSSKPDLGVSAIRLAARVMDTLDVLAEDWRRDVRFADVLERPYTVMNIARIEGGSAINIVPDRCVIDLGFRPLPGMDVEALCAQVEARVVGLGQVHVERLRVTPSMLTPTGTPLEALLRPHATDPRVGAAAFATDGGNLQRLGVQTLVFGPGSIDVAHQANEFVPVGELHRAVDVVLDVVTHRCIDT